MNLNQTQAARANPNNWNVASNNGTVVATNNVTGEAFSGSVANFNALLRSAQLSTAMREPESLIQSAIPVIVPSSGTVTTAGAITVTVAFPQIYSGGAWLWLPAGAIVGGSAGLYYCVFSSTTVGVVYTEYNDGSAFVPYAPVTANLVVATGSNAAYTTITTAHTVMSAVVPAAYMGLQGKVTIEATIANSNTGNTKTSSITFGGTELLASSNTTAIIAALKSTTQNCGVANKQLSVNGTPLAVVTSIDTAANVTIAVALASGNVADFVMIDTISITLS